MAHMNKLQLISYSDPDWTVVTDNNSNLRSWKGPHGDSLDLRYFDLAPDIPAPLSDLSTIWKFDRIQLFWDQAAPVSMRSEPVDGFQSLEMIIKIYRYNGVGARASLIIPFRDFSFGFYVTCDTDDNTVDRDDLVTKNIAISGDKSWFVDPFDFGFMSPLMCNLADDEKWDQSFPDHPLSRARRYLTRIRGLCRIDVALKSDPPFEGPQTRSPVTTTIEEFVGEFGVTLADKVSAAQTARELTEFADTILATRVRGRGGEELSITEGVSKPGAIAKKEIPANSLLSVPESVLSELRDARASRPDRKIALILYSVPSGVWLELKVA
jgi:hypothetical protein